ncbi:MAG: bifunctional DNA-formamidopyrimidine glycosylase/DNA-(apurinic or apyrimidinic site) lyase [Anaerovibrio sp.]|uniref:bifunctional DNA-formamidopyrimidine glycosylase/DNA-(apurinic or apyrimidinic site) lyase n=1 Tax=Anaerovibrio sp. TaxID=1872532 RepID=UPI0025EBAD32|nr:bifunctional DNA-formamidopyrimidine glycosylase/DNA-(apurinic or apyrimidinic site) lyase [Anaerovibrio sp.]MCR5177238.1 bifunctional DNA-formamidopyrimidine glycosylase/DNA-(apurinic or apyrimidinic site) lyase [Anaerovibrio sp.]
MPEMPELEIIRRSLEPNIKGKRIMNVQLLLKRQIKWPSPEDFIARLAGHVITGLDRRGKYLLLQMDNNVSLVFHLRMTGQACYFPPGVEPVGHVRILFPLDDGGIFAYADTRTLGTIYAMHNDELWRIKGLAELGPEPLSDDFTVAYLRSILAGKKTRIKSFLLNQAYIAGLGNIYVDEALFLSGIHPMRTAGSVTPEEAEKLYININKVISDGINDGGTTFRDYRDGNGEKGSHQQNLFAYGRDGKPCRKCGTIMEKIRVGGRGTHFCPSCQQLNKG